MNMTGTEVSDDLRPEYDFASLRVRRTGPGRKAGCRATVVLEPDVAEMFPDSESVNQALRFLIRITQKNVIPPASPANGA